jgi:hypothetical protein
MIYQLITLIPLARVRRPVGPYPIVREWSGESPPVAPDGHAYALIIDRPTPAENQELVDALSQTEDRWDLRDLTEEEIATKAEAERLAAIPQSISGAGLRLALLSTGIDLSLVDTAIASLPEEDRVGAEIYWTKSANFRRDSALLNQLATELGLSSEDVDNIFSAADQIAI